MKVTRRRFIQTGTAFMAAGSAVGCWTTKSLHRQQPAGSALGQWKIVGDIPQFHVSPALSRGQREFHMVGNRALQLQVGTDGTVGVYREADGQRWLCFADKHGGSGESLLTVANERWGSSAERWPAQARGQVIIEPTGLSTTLEYRGITLRRTVVCPEGDESWLLIAVKLILGADYAPVTVAVREHWRLNPRFLHLFEPPERRGEIADTVSHKFEVAGAKVKATEDFSVAEGVIGPPQSLSLEMLGRAGEPGFDLSESALYVDTSVDLKPGVAVTLYFRFNVNAMNVDVITDPARFFDDNQRRLKSRLPTAKPKRYPGLGQELRWHSAALSGGANRDNVLGGHTLNQGSAYAFLAGGNAAARDQLQHALPLVYTEPDLALSVLRNTCAWSAPDGDLPYALTGNKLPFTQLFRPSDQNLWLLWLAAEYGLATGDLAAFRQMVPFHPVYRAGSISLQDHLIRQYWFVVNDVGVGAQGHLRILNADWNDLALEARGVDKEQMKASGGSVLNSAMAAWVLPVFAALLDNLGEVDTANHARALARQLKLRVKASWNGRWFDRAYAPDGTAIGRDECWLEVQPWAILCGAATTAQANAVLGYIHAHHRKDSPLGARIIWPLPESPYSGMGVGGGIWYSINMTLVWAAASVNADLAWDEWYRMSLASHVHYKPSDWAGTLSGPDAWNSPEAARPGETWAYPWLSMQDYPIGNMHSHSQPLLAYLRLQGIAPTARGSVTVGRGDFHSQLLSLSADGHGLWRSENPVILETVHGFMQGSQKIRF